MSEPYDPNQPRPNQPPAPQASQAPPNPYAGGSPSPAASPYEPAPSVNPYGSAAQAYPGSKAYVEQHFGPVAGFGSRFLALLIDSLITLVGFVPMVIGLVMLVTAGPDTDLYGDSVDGTADGGQATIGVLVFLLGLVIMWGIHIWNRIFRMGRTGQSVGKRAMGLKLVHAQTGQPIGAAMAFGREVLSQVINQVVFLSSLWMLWDDNKQTLHDKIVSSTVIEVPKS